MKKFIIALCILFTVTIFVFVNTAYMKKISVQMNEIIKDAESKSVSQTIEIIDEYEKELNKQKKYLGIICEKNQIEDIQKCISEIKGYCESQDSGEISGKITELRYYTNELMSNERLKIIAIF